MSARRQTSAEPSQAVATGQRKPARRDIRDPALPASLPRRPIATRRWKTRVELANAIFEYIEVFHSRRRHSALDMRTPIEYELINNNTTTPVAA